MEEKTRLPELTSPPLRVGGTVMIIASAAVPALAWMIAGSIQSLGALVLAPVGWAIVALAGYAALGRSTESRKFAVLVCGCAALWTVVLSIGFWPLGRRAAGIVSIEEVMAIFGVAVGATGATYGFFSGIRYRDLPRTFGRALRAAAWACLPSVALSLAVFGFRIVNEYAAFTILAPFALTFAVTAVARAAQPPATRPSGRS